MEEMSANEEVQTTASGLQYIVLEPGEGDNPVAADSVEVHYEGRLVDGTVFDSSFERGQTVTFGLTQVIPGWTEGLQLMKPGAKYKFIIPPELGYGEGGAGQTIGPNATLLFDVELIAVVKADAEAE
jgi:FKBP-type peptidyl-prolyl cis-trans isomerase